MSAFSIYIVFTVSVLLMSLLQMIPPPPPMSPDMVDDEALGSVLISWYMSGYHTGYYLVCAQKLTDLLWAIKGIYSLYLQIQSLALCSEEQWVFMVMPPTS